MNNLRNNRNNKINSSKFPVLIVMNTLKENEQDQAIADDPILSAAQKHFRLTYLFPYQRLVIQNILDAWKTIESEDNEKDTMDRQVVILPTGAGKSLCFMLPGALLPGITLIVFPLLALMADQLRRITDAGLKGIMLRGGQSREEREAVWKELESGEVNFLLTNPETLQNPAILPRLKGCNIIHGVIDEAHTVNEWGKSFRPSYLELGKTLHELNIPIITAFTATASKEVLEGIEELVFPGESAHRIIGNPDRENINYSIIPTICPEYDLARLLFPLDRNGSFNPGVLSRPAIVFCQSRTSAELTARSLREVSGESDIFFYHAGLTRDEKTKIEEWFFSSDNGILTATCAYGMGVDKSNIRTVIHREPPSTVEAYLQESGRGGRDKNPAKAVMLIPWKPISGTAAKNKGRGKKVPEEAAEKLSARESAFMEGINNTSGCRRDTYLRLLGAETEYCAGCDYCRRDIQTIPRGAEELLTLLKRNPGIYTKRQIKFLLPGEGSAQIREDGLYCSREFARLQNWSPDQVGDALSILEQTGLTLRIERFALKGKWKLSSCGKQVIKNLTV